MISSQAAIAVSAAKYNVVSLGAKPDGVTDSTKAFVGTWLAACGSEMPATISVPPGRFLVGGATFSGPCKNNAIRWQIEGVIKAPADYNVLGNVGTWLLFQHVDGMSISGGVLDGQGAALWACKASGKSCPGGSTTIVFSNSRNIAVSKLTSLNSQLFHIVINGCQNVRLQGMKVLASGDSPNTDGVHVQLSSGVTITNSKIGTGDDCVSVGAGTTNLWIENVACGPGRGISIGSLGKELEEAGVQNVTVKNVVLSTGFAKNILFQHAVMSNVNNPIVIDQNYCPNNINCPGQFSGVKISDVTYQDIHGTSATEVAVKFDCSLKNPCTGIRLEDVKLAYKNNQQPAQASCVNAGGLAFGLVQPSSCL
ncbi:hypothetical protein EUGRSUZ_L02033 [Eucalyptus grandis]|uniref:Polygalacturonase n=1 Tax=Eucalyptus grandis TaxID=71139 RepID=A0A058ZSS5_EUCGR|nr:hypothetical protein EUGRSUZ_L02033 [Eucalyptus grandis]